MARFYVGQRVRVRCPTSEMDGLETTVIALDQEAYDEVIGEYRGIEVEDTQGDPWDANFDGYVFEPHELEPIIDPGHQVISWEEMADLWTPERIEA